MKICADKTLSLKILISNCVPYSFPPFYTDIFSSSSPEQTLCLFLNFLHHLTLLFFIPSVFLYTSACQLQSRKLFSPFSTLSTRIAEPEIWRRFRVPHFFWWRFWIRFRVIIKIWTDAIKRERNCQTANHIDKKNRQATNLRKRRSQCEPAVCRDEK